MLSIIVCLLALCFVYLFAYPWAPECLLSGTTDDATLNAMHKYLSPCVHIFGSITQSSAAGLYVDIF